MLFLPSIYVHSDINLMYELLICFWDVVCKSYRLLRQIH
jgi:hypothetical protein